MDKVRAPGRQPPRWEAIEARILFSADPAPLAIAGQAGTALVQAIAPDVAVTASPAAAGTAARELVLIDQRVPDAASLVADLRAQQAAGRALTIVLLDAGDDGLAVLNQALDGSQGRFDAVHLIAHGQPGRTELGRTALDLDTLRDHSLDIASWSAGFTADGDLLLYGCDVAATDAGTALVDALAALTGADVAASTDATGASVAGGDWTLERQTGRIDAALAPSLAEQQAYQGLLSAPTFGAGLAGADTIVNTTTAGPQSTYDGATGRAVATNASGRTVVVWHDQTSGADEIHARVFDANGAALTGELVLVTTNTGYQDQPAVAMRADGSFVVAWRAGNDQDGSGTGIYAGTFDANGNPISGEFRINQATNYDQALPSIAINPSGSGADFVVTWSRWFLSSASWGVEARSFTWGGLALNAEWDVNDLGAGDQTHSAIAFGANGQGVIVWQDDNHDGSGWGVFGQRIDANGDPIGFASNFGVSSVTLGQQFDPDVSVADNGDFVAVWSYIAQGGGNTSVHGRVFHANGTAMGAEFTVPADTAGSQQNASVAMRGLGDFVVTWESDSAEGNGSWGVYARQFNPVGLAESGDVLVNTTTAADQRYPSIAVRDDTAVVVWSGTSATSTPTDADGVFLRQVPLPWPGVAFTASGTITSESGGSLSIDYVLTTRPTADVTITLTPTDATELALDLTTLTFTSANWNVAQRVTVTGVNDTVVDGDVASAIHFATASGDPMYAGLSGNSPSITNTDDDTFNLVVVDTTSDVVDALDLGSLAALADGRGADGRISLREALLAANAGANGTGGADRIAFDLSAYGASATIALSSALPQISDTVLIDGTTAPGYAGRPIVQIGASPSVTTVFDFGAGADHATLRGLSIGGFGGTGIEIGAASVTIEDSQIGTSLAGNTAAGGSGAGVHVGAAGTGAVLRNDVVSGNGGSGIVVEGAAGVSITGNRIGVATTTGAPLGNALDGILLTAGATGTRVSGNVIGGNGGAGVRISGDTPGNVVQGNWIGTDATLSAALGNHDGVVLADGAGANLIGGTGADDGNLIRYNAGRGILVLDGLGQSTGNALLGNLLVGNGFGIDLVAAASAGSAAIDANDTGDADTGANGLQNFPVLAAAVPAAGSLTITGTLSSEAGATYRLEFFATTTADASGHGQARVFLGSLEVSTDGTGDAPFTVTLATSEPVGTRVTATATRVLGVGVYGSTSEYAADVVLDTAPVLAATSAFQVAENDTAVGTVAATDADAGDVVTYSLAGDDAGHFVIDSATGAIAFAAAPNYEAPLDANTDNAYQIRVVATDANGGVAERAVTVTVEDRNESPSLTGPASRTIAENGTAVASYTATDPDRPAQDLVWTLSGADAALFVLDAGTHALSFATAPDYERPADAGADNVYDVIVRVTDPGGLYAEQAVSVSVSDLNEVPSITTPAAFSVNENTTTVRTLAATDPDRPAQALTWTIAGGADASRFALSTAGALTFTAARNFEAPVDANKDNVYEITVRVSDGSLSTTADLRVTVANLNEAPTITTAGALSVAENLTQVTTLTATDPDRPAQAITWTIAGGTDAARFRIDPATQALQFVSAPDFERPTDSNVNNIYQVIVRATDAPGASTSKTLNVTVTNANDAPVLSAPASVATDEDTPLTLDSAHGNAITLSDQDLAQGPLTVTLQATLGTVSLATTQGLSFAAGDGTADATMTFTGSLADLQAALASLRFSPDANANGAAVLSVGVTDAADSSLADRKRIDVTIRPVNDSPVLATPTTIEVTAGSAAAIGTAQLNAADVDTPATALVYTVATASPLGQVQRDGQALAQGATFTQAEVAAGRIAFAAHGGVGGASEIALTLDDGGGGTPIAIKVPIRVTAVVAATTSASAAATSQTGTSTPASSTPSTATSATTTTAATGSTAAPTAAPAAATPVFAAPTDNQGGASAAERNAARAAAAAKTSPAAAVVPVSESRAGWVTSSGDTRGGYELSGLRTPWSPSDLGRRSLLDNAPRREGLPTSTYVNPFAERASAPVVASAAVRQQAFKEDIDRVREEIGQRITLERNFVASTAAISTGLSIGYVIWLLRGGVLLSSLLATVPAWRSFDPLPVLSNVGGRREGDGEDDSLQGMLKKAARLVGAGSGPDEGPTGGAQAPSDTVHPATGSASPASAHSQLEQA
jgi:VCBS repeat-containing protein